MRSVKSGSSLIVFALASSALVGGRCNSAGKFRRKAMFGKQRLEQTVGGAAEGDGDLRSLQIFKTLDLGARDQTEGDLVEDLHENAQLLAAKHRLHRRAERR